MKSLRILILALAAFAASGALCAYADDAASAPTSDFVSLDSLPGRHRMVALKTPPKFFSLRGRGNMAALSHTVKRASGVQAQRPPSSVTLPATMALPTKMTKSQARKLAAKQTGTTTSSTSASAMSQESARQILSIFPAVD